MRFSLQTLIYLCLTALASALPSGGGGGGTPRVPPPPLVPNENATWFCTHKYKVMYSYYVLNGNGWNKTEKEIRKVIENAGMTTRYKFKEVKDEDGVLGFESSFNLPLGRAKAIGQQASLLLGINPEAMNKTSGKKNNGVTCPQIK